MEGGSEYVFRLSLIRHNQEALTEYSHGPTQLRELSPTLHAG